MGTNTLPSAILKAPFHYIHDDRHVTWGWQLITDVPLTEKEISLQLYDFFQKGELYCLERVMIKRAEEAGVNLAGQLHAECLLSQGVIPVEWQDFTLIFAGTLWLASSGGLWNPSFYDRPVLRLINNVWKLDFDQVVGSNLFPRS